MAPILRCNYVNADLIYTEAHCTAPEAIALLHALMQPEMTQKLSSENARATASAGKAQPPTPPAYLLVFTFAQGEATLNVYCTPDGWEHIWIAAKPRFKWLPLLEKIATTDAAPATFETLSKSIAWTASASFNTVFDHLSSQAA